MSTHNVCFYGEIKKIIHPICPLIWSCVRISMLVNLKELKILNTG